MNTLKILIHLMKHIFIIAYNKYLQFLPKKHASHPNSIPSPAPYCNHLGFYPKLLSSLFMDQQLSRLSKFFGLFWFCSLLFHRSEILKLIFILLYVSPSNFSRKHLWVTNIFILPSYLHVILSSNSTCWMLVPQNITTKSVHTTKLSWLSKAELIEYP